MRFRDLERATPFFSFFVAHTIPLPDLTVSLLVHIVRVNRGSAQSLIEEKRKDRISQFAIGKVPLFVFIILVSDGIRARE